MYVLLADNEKPRLTCPIDMESLPTRGHKTGVLQYDVPKATDNVDSRLVVTCDPKPGSILKMGTTTVTCYTSDTAGNDETCSFDVTLKDNKATKIPGHGRPMRLLRPNIYNLHN